MDAQLIRKLWKRFCQKVPGYPKCKDRARDKAHSLRSSLRRPCLRMSSRAQSIMHAVLLGKKSAIKMIDSSDAFKQLWLGAGKVVPDPMPGRRCNIGFAPQRFESEARPLASIATMPERFLKTYLHWHRERPLWRWRRQDNGQTFGLGRWKSFAPHSCPGRCSECRFETYPNLWQVPAGVRKLVQKFGWLQLRFAFPLWKAWCSLASTEMRWLTGFLHVPVLGASLHPQVFEPNKGCWWRTLGAGVFSGQMGERWNAKLAGCSTCQCSNRISVLGKRPSLCDVQLGPALCGGSNMA